MAQAELDKEQKRMASQVDAEYQVALNKEANVRKVFNDAKAEVETQADKSIEYNILKREAESTRDLYQSLLKRLKEANVQSGLTSNNIQLVDAANAPLGPTLPHTGQNISLGVV